MTWVAVAVAGGALIGGAASYVGSKKQGDAAKRASSQQMDMFRLVNAQQQPFIQSGYGAMGRLNTLLGIGGRASPPGTGMAPPMVSANQQGYLPNRQGGMDMRIPPPVSQGPRAMGAPGGNPRLAQLLALRAQNGDTEAARMLGLQ